MSVIFENLERAIRNQLKGHSGDTVEMAGEQLLDMVRGAVRSGTERTPAGIYPAARDGA